MENWNRSIVFLHFFTLSNRISFIIQICCYIIAWIKCDDYYAIIDFSMHHMRALYIHIYTYYKYQYFFVVVNWTPICATGRASKHCSQSLKRVPLSNFFMTFHKKINKKKIQKTIFSLFEFPSFFDESTASSVHRRNIVFLSLFLENFRVKLSQPEP